MTTDIEHYFVSGCGRCKLTNTPECKVHTWQKELATLRTILHRTRLKEEIKWGVPCYTYKGKNVVILSAFKHHCALNFFKGALLEDPANILIPPGENSQSSRVIQFTQVEQYQSVLLNYIDAAILVEESGKKVVYQSTHEAIPPEFSMELANDPQLKAAFDALSFGKQRGYLLHFSQAKQSKTWINRTAKQRVNILHGKSFNG